MLKPRAYQIPFYQLCWFFFPAWIITKLICYKLWLADRIFPLVPVRFFTADLPNAFHLSLFVISMACMIWMMVKPAKAIAALLLVVEIVSCLLDQNRWQPWEYQFIFMLAAYVFSKEEKSVLAYWRMIMAALLFFSGFCKFNSAFIHDVWNHLILHRWLHIQTGPEWLSRLGYLLPLIEMAAAIGLLFRKTVKYAVLILVAMHMLILLMFGPFGLNINSVIWPWNVLMLSLLLLLFFRTEPVFEQTLLMRPFFWIVLMCWWILPWTRQSGYWDKYLSAVLYSGGVEQLFICSNNSEATEATARFYEKQFRVIPCDSSIAAYYWGMKEMNTAPYPERRVYEGIAKKWRERFHDSTARFYIFKPGFRIKVEELKEGE